MSYLVFFTKYASRLLKKLAPNIKVLVSKEIELISKNPHQASQLTGKFSFLRSWHVYMRGVPYRIVFQVEEQTKKVLVHLVAKRADAYRLLERLFK